MRRSFPLLVSVSSFVIALDWWTKRWATENLIRHEPIEILGPLLRFTYTRNSGVAFGLGAGLPFPFWIFSVIAVIAIFYLFMRSPVHAFSRQLALALILGGAIGNLIDRVMLGEVVDFIDVGWGGWHWPVFNIADSAVTIGVVLFGITWVRSPMAGEAGAGTPPVGVAGDARAGSAAEQDDDSDPGDLGGSVGRRGAAGPLPGDGAGRPLA